MSEQETGSAEGVESQEQVDPAVLREAEDYGWVPLEQWKHDAEDWVPADQYVKRGREVNRFLNHNLNKERQRSARLEQEIAQIRESAASFEEYKQRFEKAIYDQAVRDVKSQLREARANGDTDVEAQLEEKLDDLKDQAPKPVEKKTAQTPQAEHPAFTAWKAQNSWYGTNEDLTAYADSVFIREVQKAKKSGVQIDPEESLATVTAAVKRTFPNEFGGGTRPAMFERSSGGGGTTRSGSGKGYATLPPEAKQVFERYFKDGYYPGMKKEEAQQQYFNDYSS